MGLFETVFPSPVGDLTLVASDDGLVAILWQDDDPARVRLAVRQTLHDHPILKTASAELTEYFTGKLRHFAVPLDFRGTDFQQKVWAALVTIPYGETRSYGEIARAIGHPTASRAVGAANGRNPISIIAPCHRVIGAKGALTGFAGGMDAKRWLLDFEQSGDRLL
ncbi:methylated-DNA--[protein]-cysteine S-methyltransferase [Sphingobium sp. CR2-8]|uniref:methylated-DNA--[protein]-cysteine S-methyltransferase n=1 Tax=Sphingobium sp. CR2-8 TaxID=1306534 RepID=UPI002DBFB2D4|nr:methylated-DNA--[protein]-cysteine S-methyltransferase [Sphingobium sp. CR2-8]MEC3911093.1 methylated-DNA--[protein]-cysteine S-methyltransferase [Sphingobium sp. CR2-8]